MDNFLCRVPEGVNEFSRGYCYLRWFVEVGASVGQVRSAARNLGPYPPICNVLGHLCAFCNCIHQVLSDVTFNGRFLHVTSRGPRTTFLVLLTEYVGKVLPVGAEGGGDFVAMEFLKTAGLDLAMVLRDFVQTDIKNPNSALREQLQVAMSERITASLKSGKKIGTVFAQFRLSPVEQIRIQNAFPELTLDFAQGGRVHPHAFSAVHRHCELEICLREINYDIRAKPAANFDTVVKDIGGNFLTHLARGRFNIHSCCPILDARDACRASNRRFDLTCLREKLVGDRGRKLERVLRSDLETRRVVCDRRAECCPLTAPTAVLLHANYDLKPRDLADALDIAGVVKCAGAFLFSTDVILQRSGTIEAQNCNWSRYTDSRGERIRFSFLNDSSLDYDHDFETYIYLATAHTITSSRNILFFVEIKGLRNGVLLFTIVRNLVPHVPISVVSHNLWVGDAGLTAIEYYDYLPRLGTFYICTPEITLRKKRLLVSTRLVDAGIAYALGVSQQKFSVQGIYEYMRSINNRVIVNGVDVLTPSRVPAEVLYDTTYAIYVYCFRRRYESSLVMNALLEDEKIFRECEGGSFWRNLWAKVIRRTTHVRIDDGEDGSGSGSCFQRLWLWLSYNRRFPVKIEDAVLMCPFEERIDEFLFHGKEFKDTSVAILNPDGYFVVQPEVDPAVQAFVGDVLSSVAESTVSMSSAAVSSTATSVKSDVVAPVPVDTVPVSVGASVSTSSDLESLSNCSVPVVVPVCPSVSVPDSGVSVDADGSFAYSARRLSISSCVDSSVHSSSSESGFSFSFGCPSSPECVGVPSGCDCDLVCSAVPGDGQCCFSSLIVSADLRISVPELRADLLSSRFLDCLFSPDDTRKLLSDATAWGDDEVIRLFALHYRKVVCVHIEKLNTCLRYSGAVNSEVVHVRFSGSHYDALLPTGLPSSVPGVQFCVERESGCMQGAVLVDMRRHLLNSPDVVLPVENLIRDLRTKVGLVDPDILSDARKRCNPADALDRGRFVCRSALKLVELDKRVSLFTGVGDSDGIVDLCGAPGGFLQCLMSHSRNFRDIFTISLQGSDVRYKYSYLPVVSSNVHFYFSNDLTGDICSPAVRNEFCDYVRSFYPSGVPVVVADGAVGCVGAEDRQDLLNLPLLLSEFECASRLLCDGGNFVVKIFDCFLPSLVEAIVSLSASFRDVSVVKPLTSRPACSEKYLVFSGFRRNNFEVVSFDRVRSACLEIEIRQVAALKSLLQCSEETSLDLRDSDLVRRMRGFLKEQKRVSALKRCDSSSFVASPTSFVLCGGQVTPLSPVPRVNVPPPTGFRNVLLHSSDVSSDIVGSALCAVDCDSETHSSLVCLSSRDVLPGSVFSGVLRDDVRAHVRDFVEALPPSRAPPVRGKMGSRQEWLYAHCEYRYGKRFVLPTASFSAVAHLCQPIVDQFALQQPNACLLVYYPPGTVGLNFHRDDEPVHDSEQVITICFGAACSLVLVDDRRVELARCPLVDGDFYVFLDQKSFLHGVDGIVPDGRGRWAFTFRIFKGPSFVPVSPPAVVVNESSVNGHDSSLSFVSVSSPVVVLGESSVNGRDSSSESSVNGCDSSLSSVPVSSSVAVLNESFVNGHHSSLNESSVNVSVSLVGTDNLCDDASPCGIIYDNCVDAVFCEDVFNDLLNDILCENVCDVVSSGTAAPSVDAVDCISSDVSGAVVSSIVSLEVSACVSFLVDSVCAAELTVAPFEPPPAFEDVVLDACGSSGVPIVEEPPDVSVVSTDLLLAADDITSVISKRSSLFSAIKKRVRKAFSSSAAPLSPFLKKDVAGVCISRDIVSELPYRDSCVVERRVDAFGMVRKEVCVSNEKGCVKEVVVGIPLLPATVEIARPRAVADHLDKELARQASIRGVRTSSERVDRLRQTRSLKSVVPVGCVSADSALLSAVLISGFCPNETPVLVACSESEVKFPIKLCLNILVVNGNEFLSCDSVFHDLIVEDVADYLDLVRDRVHNKSLSHGLFCVASGRSKFKTVVTVVTSVKNFLLDLAKFLQVFPTVCSSPLLLTVGSFDVARWLRTPADVVGVFSQFDSNAYAHRYQVFIRDANLLKIFRRELQFLHRFPAKLDDPRHDSTMYDHWRRSARNRSTTGFSFSPKYFPTDGTPDVIARNALIEQLELWRAREAILFEEHKKFYSLIPAIIDSDVKEKIELSGEGYGLFDVDLKKFIVNPKLPRSSYEYAFDGVRFVKLDAACSGRVELASRRVLVSNNTELMQDERLYTACKDLQVSDFVLPSVTLKQGVPGCGKTTYILKNYAKPSSQAVGDLVLFSTREGVEDFRLRARTDDPSVIDFEKKNFRTLHSFLINSRGENFSRVIVDEALMVHAGELLFAAFKAKCSELVLVGDQYQIPYINRMPQCQVLYSDPMRFASVSEKLSVSYRCTLSVASLLYDSYPGGMRAVSRVLGEMRREVFTSLAAVPKRDDTKYLVFKQSEKAEMKKLGFNVSTIHEYQGKQAKHVIVVRLSRKKEEIYEKKAHCLVAITRHTHSFTYYSPVSGDQISRYILSANCLGSEKIDRAKFELSGGFFRDDYVSVPSRLIPSRSGAITHDNIYSCVGRWGVPDVRVDVPSSESKFVGPVLCPVLLPDPCVDIGILQRFYDVLLPGNSLVDMRFDSDNVLNSCDLHLGLESTRFDVLKRSAIKTVAFDRLRPVLRTSMAPPRPSNQVETLLAMIKRNQNVPDLVGDVAEAHLADLLVGNFVRTYVHPQHRGLFDSFREHPILPNSVSISEWLTTQPPHVVSRIGTDVFIGEKPLTLYNFMVKSSVKPQLDAGATTSYASLQTIAYHEKDVNAIFCPIFREIKKRLLAILDPRFLIYCDVSPDDFADELSRRFDADTIAKLKKLEIDIAKYDKSQGGAALLFECRMMRLFGVAEEYIQLWMNAHVRTVLFDRKNGVKSKVAFQRKSGDASTFLGNTLFLMAVIATIFDLSGVVMALFSGDDSLIAGGDIDHDRNELCALLFNLESKFLREYDYMYFCSKFLITFHGRFFFVPDPLKLVTKLGRGDLVNFYHVEEYRISLVDLTKAFGNILIYSKLSAALNERYMGFSDYHQVFSCIYSLMRNRAAFHDLFYTLPSDVLCMDVCRPNLD